MKILFLCAFLPVEFGSGSAMRSYQLLTELQKHAEVDVVSANNWPITADALAEFRGNYRGHLKIAGHKSFTTNARPLSPALTKLVNLDQYDYIFSRYYWPAFWLGLFELNNLIIDCDDCDLEVLEHEYSDRRRSLPRRLLSLATHRIFERRYLTNLASARAQIYSRMSDHARQLPNSFEIPNKLSPLQEPEHSTPVPDRSTVNILFVGVLNYSPNIDGIDHFLGNIWPTVRKRFPQARFTIVGANLKKRTANRWRSKPDVDVQGYVRDIEDAYKLADICVVPVYRGGGVHIKIMEAFKYRKPVVISLESQRGYQNRITDGHHAMIAQSDEAFVEKLSALIKCESTRNRMAQSAHTIFDQHYSIDTDDHTMHQILQGNRIADLNQHNGYRL